MNLDNLVLMANRIGEFFEAMPDRDEALDGIATHIRRFWALRMREQLAAFWSGGGAGGASDGGGLSPIVQAALDRHSILPATPVVAPPAEEAVARHDWDGASES